MVLNLITWDTVLDRIRKEKGLDSQSETSDKRGLLFVFEKAREIGLNGDSATHAYYAQISNLRTALPEMRRCIRWGNYRGIEQILKLCHEKSNVDLRLALHTCYLDDVPVKRNNGHFEVMVTPKQFDELQTAMRLRHRYQVEEPKPANDFLDGYHPYDIYQ